MHIEKEKIRVVAAIDKFRIVGDMHSFPGARLLDLMNAKESAFIPLTEAEIYSLADGKLVYKAPFLAVNRTAINFVYQTEIRGQEKQE